MVRCFKLELELELEQKIFEVEVELELKMRTVLIKKNCTSFFYCTCALTC